MASRIAPLTGAIFVVVLIVGFVVAGEAPDAERGNARELVDHYVDNKDSVMIGAALTTWAAAAMAFFGGYLRTVLRDRGGDSGFLPSMAMAGALAIAIGGAIDATIIFTMAETADDVGAGTTLTLSALFENDFFPVALGTFIFLLATGLSIVRGAGALPKWMGWVAIAFGITALTPIGFIGFMGMGLFTLVASILLTIRAGSPAAPAAPQASPAPEAPAA